MVEATERPLRGVSKAAKAKNAIDDMACVLEQAREALIFCTKFLLGNGPQPSPEMMASATTAIDRVTGRLRQSIRSL